MKSTIKNLLEFQLYYLMIQGALIGIFKLPALIKYVLDLNLIIITILVVLSNIRQKTVLFERKTRKFMNYVWFYCIAIVVIALIRLVDLGPLFWAIKNNFFFILYFAYCILYFDRKDVDRIIGRVVGMQVFNVICVIIEYGIMGQIGDNVGGMFGVEKGCNAILNMYLVIISVYMLSLYLNNRTSLIKLFLIIGSSLFIATISELKIYYIEILIAFIVMLLLKRSFKALAILIFAIVFVSFAIESLAALGNKTVSIFESIENFFDYGSSAAQNDSHITRFSFITQINRLFFKGDLLLNLFGYGFGACESSKTFYFFHSDFAKMYDELRYRNLSSSMLYLETGAVGLIMFISIFVLMLFIVINYRIKNKTIPHITMFAISFIILVIVNIFYNSGIRLEVAYLTYFGLAMFFVYIKKDNRKVNSQNNKYINNGAVK